MTDNSVAQWGDMAKALMSGGAPSTVTTIKGAKGILQDKVTVYVLPESIPNKERAFVMYYLTLCGLSLSTSQKQWNSWVATMMTMACPDLLVYLPDTMASKEPLSSDWIARVKNYYIHIDNQQAPIDQREALPSGYSVAPEIPEGLPACLEDFPAELLNYLDSYEAIYGYIGIIVFLSGKTPTPGNLRQFQKTRPDAVERKYNLIGCPILTGKNQLGQHSLKYINQCWINLPSFRQQTILWFAERADLDTSSSMDALHMTFRLLRYANMHPITFCTTLLDAFSELPQVPALRPAIKSYLRQVEVLMKQPVNLRPYFKVIYTDRTEMMTRKGMEPLTAVAVVFLRMTEPTLREYAMPAGHQATIEAAAAFIKNEYKTDLQVTGANQVMAEVNLV